MKTSDETLSCHGAVCLACRHIVMNTVAKGQDLFFPSVMGPPFIADWKDYCFRLKLFSQGLSELPVSYLFLPLIILRIKVFCWTNKLTMMKSLVRIMKHQMLKNKITFLCGYRFNWKLPVEENKNKKNSWSVNTCTVYETGRTWLKIFFYG